MQPYYRLDFKRVAKAEAVGTSATEQPDHLKGDFDHRAGGGGGDVHTAERLNQLLDIANLASADRFYPVANAIFAYALYSHSPSMRGQLVLETQRGMLAYPDGIPDEKATRNDLLAIRTSERYLCIPVRLLEGGAIRSAIREGVDVKTPMDRGQSTREPATASGVTRFALVERLIEALGAPDKLEEVLDAAKEVLVPGESCYFDGLIEEYLSQKASSKPAGPAADAPASLGGVEEVAAATTPSAQPEGEPGKPDDTRGEHVIRIENGFERWMRVWTWNGRLFKLKDGCEDCTWSGDAEVDRQLTLDADVKGAVVYHRYEGHTPTSSVSFFGFSKDELAAPSPKTGYFEDVSGASVCSYSELNTFEDYLRGLITKSLMSLESFKVIAEDGDLKVRTIPYVWGDQAAEDYILTQMQDEKEVVLARMRGCGDSAPYLRDDWAYQARNAQNWTSCKLLDWHDAQWKWEDEIRQQQEQELDKKFGRVLEPEDLKSGERMRHEYETERRGTAWQSLDKLKFPKGV